MGGEHNSEHLSNAPIIKRCVHGIYEASTDSNGLNRACSICRSMVKRQLSPQEIRDTKKENKIFK